MMPAWSYASGYTQATNPVTNANMRQSLTAGDWAALTFSGHSVIRLWTQKYRPRPILGYLGRTDPNL
jgi:hypothetical protein